jgi:hypothetical protein
LKSRSEYEPVHIFHRNAEITLVHCSTYQYIPVRNQYILVHLGKYLHCFHTGGGLANQNEDLALALQQFAAVFVQIHKYSQDYYLAQAAAFAS